MAFEGGAALEYRSAGGEWPLYLQRSVHTHRTNTEGKAAAGRDSIKLPVKKLHEDKDDVQQQNDKG